MHRKNTFVQFEFVFYVLQAWHVLSLTMMVASIAVVVLETVSSFRVQHCEIFDETCTERNLSQNNNSQGNYSHEVSPANLLHNWIGTVPNLNLLVVEVITFCFLLIELPLRFIASFNKKRFFCKFLNICDLIVLLSQARLLLYLNLYHALGYDTTTPQMILLFETPRIIRVARILSVAKHFTGVYVIARAIKHSRNELVLLFGLLACASVFYASILFYVELHIDKINNIPMGMWFAVVTMTTVGYGDYVPVSTAGYIVGGFCAVSGIVLITLATPVIVNNFRRVRGTTKLCEIIDKRVVEVSEISQVEVTQEGFVTIEFEEKGDNLPDKIDKLCDLPQKKRSTSRKGSRMTISTISSSKMSAQH